jgi:ubiquinone/menaquinone biosynthesis C-methylase UbiE
MDVSDDRMPAVASTDRVRDYWEKRPCGSDGDPFPEGSEPYFRWLTENRYALEPFIERAAQFDRRKGRRVLEVGFGAGTDAERFARSGAIYTGVDLTAHGVDLGKRRFELAGLEGDLRQANAERLPFADGEFDFVYSWGVIHHSPDTAAAAAELERVCRPGGEICCMVYNRRSLYALQGKIAYGWLRGRPGRSIDEIASEHFESPGTKLLDEPGFRRLFPRLEKVRVSFEVTPYDVRVSRRAYLPAPVRALVPRRFGYFMILEGVRK